MPWVAEGRGGGGGGGGGGNRSMISEYMYSINVYCTNVMLQDLMINDSRSFILGINHSGSTNAKGSMTPQTLVPRLQ